TRRRGWMGSFAGGAAGALVAMLAVMTAGCGSGSNNPLALVQKASAATIDAHTARMSVSMATSGIAGTNLSQTGEGLTDFSAHKLQLTFGATGAPSAQSQQNL